MPLRRLSPEFRFLYTHAAIGFALSALFVAALLWSDFRGIGRLLLSPQTGWWPVLLLWFFVGLTLGSVQFGTAVILKGYEPPPDEPGRGGGRRARLTPPASPRPAPLPVRAGGRRISRRS